MTANTNLNWYWYQYVLPGKEIIVSVNFTLIQFSDKQATSARSSMLPSLFFQKCGSELLVVRIVMEDNLIYRAANKEI
jgi:hypothetical protein